MANRGPKFPPPKIPSYQYRDWLGSGGFADVFRYQDSLSRAVAVKVQHPGTTAALLAAFETEASLMAQLSNHPNIVSIYVAGVAEDSRRYLVMELCSAQHLAARIKNRPLPVATALSHTIRLAGALETAHRFGILHRDIKPPNILFTRNNSPALTDFGISSTNQEGLIQNALSPFWAPWEQHPNSGVAVGPWSDVFSLAATSWAMLAGRSPLNDPAGKNDQLSLGQRARRFAAPRTGRSDVPEILERVLATALAADPDQRYQSMIEFASALQRVQAELGEPITQPDVWDQEEAESEPEVVSTGTQVVSHSVVDIYQDSTTNADSTEQLVEPTVVRRSAARAVGAAEAPPFGPASSAGERTETAGSKPVVEQEKKQLTQVQPSGTTEPLGAAEKRAELAQKKGGGWKIALAGALGVLMLGGGMFYLLGTGSWQEPATKEPSPGASATPQPQDPALLRVPPVEDLAGQAEGEQAVFNWTHPDPKPGDAFIIQELSTAEESPQRRVEGTSVQVPLQPGNTCIVVIATRSNGQASVPKRACVSS